MRSTRTRTRHRWIAAVASVALVVAACGGDDDDDVTGGRHRRPRRGRCLDHRGPVVRRAGSRAAGRRQRHDDGRQYGHRDGHVAGDHGRRRRVRRDTGTGREPRHLRTVRHRQPGSVDVVVVQHPVPHLRGVPTPAHVRHRTRHRLHGAGPQAGAGHGVGGVRRQPDVHVQAARGRRVAERGAGERPAVRRRRRESDVRGDHGRGPSGEPAVAGHLDRDARRPHRRAASCRRRTPRCSTTWPATSCGSFPRKRSNRATTACRR